MVVRGSIALPIIRIGGHIVGVIFGSVFFVRALFCGVQRRRRRHLGWAF
jgi:hypothetical protein